MFEHSILHTSNSSVAYMYISKYLELPCNFNNATKSIYLLHKTHTRANTHTHTHT